MAEIYTMGTWQVKPGKEKEFAAEWRGFAARTMEIYKGPSDARLLRDVKESGRYHTFGPWKSMEDIEEWRESPEFKAFMEKAEELCEDMQLGTFEVVAHVKK